MDAIIFGVGFFSISSSLLNTFFHIFHPTAFHLLNYNLKKKQKNKTLQVPVKRLIYDLGQDGGGNSEEVHWLE